MPLFEKILWLELIGFDNTLHDFGVGQFLADMPQKPAAVSLLLWDANIIHEHPEGLREDAPLGARQCAYGARERNEDRMRQDWTRFQLRDLVAELQKHGIKVYPSVFDQCWGERHCKSRNIPWQPEWIDEHPEVRYTFANEHRGDICPWKRLADGTLYEDFFIDKLRQLLLDYHFDGFHCADGFAHPRNPICQGDFSDDMLEQFSSDTGIQVPELAIPQRARWILDNARHEWTAFHTRRHAQFCGKIVRMLDSIGLEHVFNTCWTRDPIEAVLRYGVDYRLLAEAGVRNFIVEATTSVLETEGWNYSNIPKQDAHRAMLMQLQAAVPQCRLVMLHGVKDGMEQYNSLRDCPPFVESDACALANLTCNGKRILQGMTVCLADAIRPQEWQRLDAIYLRNFTLQPVKCPYPTVIWSNAALTAELNAYEYGRAVCNSHELHARLLAAGAVVPAIADVDHLPDGPLVIIHPAFFPADERAKITDAAKGNLVEIGLDTHGDFIFRLTANGQLRQNRTLQLKAPADAAAEVTSWLYSLPEHLPDMADMAQIAADINEPFSPVAALTTPDLIRLWGYTIPTGQLALFVGNEKMLYHRGSVLLKGNYVLDEVLASSVVLPPFVETVPEGTRLFVKLPPHGTLTLLVHENTPGRTESKHAGEAERGF